MLQSTTLGNQFKPAILQCFGDIATAIGPAFETYLSVVAQVLEQASSVTATPDGPYEMFDYVISLREGIMDAWGGIIGAMKTGGKSQVLQPYVQSIFELLRLIAGDASRSESLMRASMGVIGYVLVLQNFMSFANLKYSDLAESFPNGELVDAFRQDWVTSMIKETKTNRDFHYRTIDVARWAREQVKRQIAGGNA